MKQMVLLTFSMSQIFDLGKIQTLKFFLRRKKYPASVSKSGVVEYCLVRFWLKWMMKKGQHNDFPKAKRLYYNIHKLFWEFNAFGPQFSMIRVSDPQKMAKMENKLSRDHFWSNIQF